MTHRQPPSIASSPMAPPASPAANKWAALVLVLTGVVMGTLDTSITNVALPAIAQDFGATVNHAGWVQYAYVMTLGTGVLVFGRMADRAGFRRVYVLGFTVFNIGTALCALSPSIEALVAARVLQAIGGAAIIANGGALLTLSFPPEQRGRALGAIPLGVSVGITLGPALGGYLTRHFGWPAVFWVNVPIGLAGLVLSVRTLGPLVVRREQGPFDVAGLLLLILANAALVTGASLAIEPGFGIGHPLVLAMCIATPVLAAVIVVVEARTPHPLVPVRLLRGRVFGASALAGAVSMIVVFGSMHLLSFHMQRIQGWDAELTGLVMLTSPIVLSVFGPVSGWISDRFGGGIPRLGGIALGTIGAALLAGVPDHAEPWDYIWRLAIYACGMGLFQTPNNHVTFDAAPRDQMGSASGFMASMRIGGQLTGFVTATVALSALLAWHTDGPPPAVEHLTATPASVAAFRESFLIIAGAGVVALVLSVIGEPPRRKRPEANIIKGGTAAKGNPHGPASQL